MKVKIGCAVVYRWRLREGMELSFQEAWDVLTRRIMEQRDGLGSRLHRTDEGEWLAYAQWPSREALERSRELGTVDAAASAQMRAAVEQAYEPIFLTPTEDLLVSK